MITPNSSDKIVAYGITYDDVLLIPGYSDFKRQDISLKTKFTKKITLESPFVSAPMDTVTEADLAIALAQEGGIGIIHRNFTIMQQAEQVQKVKKKKIPGWGSSWGQ